MTMNNWTLAVSSFPDENHCQWVTDTPSVLLTILSPLAGHGGSPPRTWRSMMQSKAAMLDQDLLSLLLACTLHTLELSGAE